LRPLRRVDPRPPRGGDGGARRRRAGRVRARCRVRRPAVGGAARGRRAGAPLLHDQQGAGDARRARGIARGATVGAHRLPRGMSVTSTRPDSFDYEGHPIVYDEYGSGDRVLVLTHGLLMNSRMYERIAPAIAEKGNRVICLNMLGHGPSDGPDELGYYSMS